MSTEKIRSDLSFPERIAAARKRTGLNQKEVSDKTGVSVPSLSRYERGDREPTLDVLKKLASFYEVSSSWLLTGEGPMRPVISREGAVAIGSWLREAEDAAAERSEKRRKKNLISIKHTDTTPELTNVEPYQDRLPLRRVPLLSWVQAGGFVDPDCQTTPGYAECYEETAATASQSAFALVVKGDSMEPEFTNGDIIVVDPDRRAVHGSYIVAKNGTEATFKQFIKDGSSVFFKPLNSRYPIMNMTGIDIKIVGVVVEKKKRY